MKRLLVVVAAAGLLTLGSAGAATAQTSGGSTPNPTSPSSASPNRHRGRVVAGVLKVSAQTLGIKPRDLVSGLCRGQTLAQVASAHGKTAQDVINALVQKADQRIQASEKAGKITQAQEVTREAKVKDRVTKLVTSYQVPMQRCQRLQGGGAGATTPTTGSST